MGWAWMLVVLLLAGLGLWTAIAFNRLVRRRNLLSAVAAEGGDAQAACAGCGVVESN